jgi:hypothetical protein
MKRFRRGAFGYTIRGDAAHAAHRRDPGMSIKSDRWTRRMAQQYRMIEPFEPEGHQ